MSDAFRESNTNVYRQMVTFVTGFGVTADQTFSIGSPSTNNSYLKTYQSIIPLGGVSGHVPSGRIIRTIDWENQILSTYPGLERIRWGDSQLRGDWGEYNTSLDWANGYLINGNNGNNSVEWFTSCLKDTNAGGTTLDWQNRILSGNWTITGYVLKSQTGGFGGGNGTSLPYLITGSGRPNYLSKFTSYSGLIESNIIDSGSNVSFQKPLLSSNITGYGDFSLLNDDGTSGIIFRQYESTLQPLIVVNNAKKLLQQDILRFYGYDSSLVSLIASHPSTTNGEVFESPRLKLEGSIGNGTTFDSPYAAIYFQPTYSNGGKLHLAPTNSLGVYIWRHENRTPILNIGSNSTEAQLNIGPNNAGKKGLIISGYVGQTSNLQEWKASNDSILSYVNSSGNIYLSGKQVTTGGPYYPFNSNPSGYLTKNQINTPSSGILFQTQVINWSGGNTFRFDLTGNYNFGMTGFLDGQTIIIKLKNTGMWTGLNTTLTTGGWPNYIKWPNGATPYNTATGTDIFTFISFTGLEIYGNYSQGYPNA